jgi:imidazolonepropionase-like amidohydrolase
MRLPLLLLLFLLSRSSLYGQVTFPVNGIPDERKITHALVNARVVTDYQTTLDSATIIIRNGVIESIGRNLVIPPGSVIHDLSGRWVYPSFIDPYTSYGLPEIPKADRQQRSVQITSNTKGAYSWNQALKPETEAHRLFTVQNEMAEKYRKSGFGAVMSFQQDGIARGTACLVTTGEEPEQEVMILERAAACYSFKKGTSGQDYPTSEMGAIALLRQSFLDARWYAAGGKNKEFNISIQSWINNQDLPQVMECDYYLQSLRADKLGDEFGVKYIIRGSGDEYKRLNEIVATGNSYILPLKFPDPSDVSDPYDALNLSLGDLIHWEHAPVNASYLNKAGVTIAFTAAGLKDPSEVLEQLRKVVAAGLPSSIALKAMTETPAGLLRAGDRVGTLQKGKLANLLVTSGDLFKKETVLLQNWVRGKVYQLKAVPDSDLRGSYILRMPAPDSLKLNISGEIHQTKNDLIRNSDTLKAQIEFAQGIFSMSFEIRRGDKKGAYQLNGYELPGNPLNFRGTGTGPDGNSFEWQLVRTGLHIVSATPDTARADSVVRGSIRYPAKAYGFNLIPSAEKTLIRNATVWTNEKEGILTNTDVLLKNGKIESVGKNIVAPGAVIVDGTGKHVTCGIIDEHSHIAVSQNVNECSHAVTSEVRIGDVLDPDDINLYRQLAGGVTTAQLLHGSCNPIGGQSAIIKFRWGQPAEKLKFENAPGFIKFALGENVKQSNWGDNNKIRYPQSRMGVEQTYVNAFTRAREYEAAWKKYNPKSKAPAPRRDLRLEALVEILNGKRFITCHSYQQGEINMLMHLADSMGFKVNTFTHILEGYKVADKMKKHGVGASSFSDWWAYKYEVIEAIPYNGAILHDVGVVTAFNSDDAEMARRLNQEAAKAVLYGGVPEEEALKFVTLNPAKLLRIDHRVGSIKAGKDADVVVWNGPPLSVYSRVEKTFVDGILYFDAQRDLQMRQEIEKERARILKLMADEKNKGRGDMKKPSFKPEHQHHCEDFHDDDSEL